MMPVIGAAPPSNWVARWSHLLPVNARVLDVACGQGRHMRHFQGLGHRVTGIDRSPEALVCASKFGETVLADLESAPWPLVQTDGKAQTFDAIVVTNYLWRPLAPVIIESLKAGGLLFYETFSQGQELWGRPNNPDFILRSGELLQLFAELHVIAYECGLIKQPNRQVQRLVACAHPGADTPMQHPLENG